MSIALRSLCFTIVCLFLLNTSIRANSDPEITSAFITDQQTIELTLESSVDNSEISVRSVDGIIEISGINEVSNSVFTITTADHLDYTKRYFVKAGNSEHAAQVHWKAIDALYTYSGQLGAIYSDVGIYFKLWAPLATDVTLNLFEGGLDRNPYRRVPLERGEKGVWSIISKKDLTGQFYSYSVTNYGETTEILDPYAKSMAVSTRETFFTPRGAIVNPTEIGPQLEFANIEGFENREDAIIWEIHVRDFTVDPDITTEAQFGTYNAFSEKLSYVKELGITHIQLLPVLSYTYSDETINDIRNMNYEVGGNYNWGYGPDNYFSPDGMYSEDPTDPELRIKELKELVQSIHEEGIGVTLDVVYNHTAHLSFLEDIVPGYYHFMDNKGTPKESYGGGRPGSTHAMVRKLIVDSIVYWTKEYKVDGFRYDLMGDLDAETIQIAYDEARKVNPKLIKVGECWRTFAGDDGEVVTPADQDWMHQTSAVSCFSDEIRNELKSGFGSEGEQRFLTGGARDILTIYNNVIAKPGNMTEDDPGDVLQYIAAHDNLTLHDVIAHSSHLDPATQEDEIQKRIRLGNTMILTSQGIPFIHAGQEYGRTKQWISDVPPEREYINIEGFENPYFIENSYDASDAVNMFDWDKVTEPGIHKETMEYTRGLIELRKSTDAFRQPDEESVKQNVSLIESDDIQDVDLVIGFLSKSSKGEKYYTFINADSKTRTLNISSDLTNGNVLVDSDEAGSSAVSQVNGVAISEESITIDPLTAVVIKVD